jgi:hypothetical protein
MLNFRGKVFIPEALRSGRVEGSLPEGSSFPPSIRDYIWWAVEWLREPLPFENSIGGVGVSPTGGLSLSSSSSLKERGVTACSSRSPIKLVRSVFSVTERNFDRGVFKHGAIHLARLPPLTSFSVTFRIQKW